MSYVTFSATGEPTTAMMRDGVRLALTEACDVVIGFGGGSAIDAAKAIATLVANGGDPLDYMEGIGAGKPLTQPALPIIAIPTTAGTGAEVTRNAVVASPEGHRVKASLRSPFMLPRLALVDPELTYSLPPEVTAGTGLGCVDAAHRAVHQSSGQPDDRRVLPRGFGRVPLARCAAPTNTAMTPQHARDMALASLFGGLALANAGLGAAHGFAAPICGMFPAPHGATCAASLPHVMAADAAGSSAPAGRCQRSYAMRSWRTS